MSRQRWDGKLYGRNGFDTFTGREWEDGPDLRYVNGLTPDIPWRLLKPGNRWKWDNGRWAITEFGLEPLYWTREDRYERFMIPVHRLLDTHDRGPVYAWPIEVAGQNWLDLNAFEEAYRKAIEIHRCNADELKLLTSFKRARGLRRRASLALRAKIASPHAATGGFVIQYGWPKSAKT